MKYLKFFFLVFLMSCASSNVLTDYDVKTDFTQYKTFDFFEDNGENLNEFDVKRITTVIQKELEILGLNQNSTPDFFIYFNTNTSENQNNNTIAIGLGSGGRNGGFGVLGGIPIGVKKLNEELIIEFVTSKKKELFWKASLISIIKEKRTPQERIIYLQEVVQKILKELPLKE